jgi:frataxin-like iron-binding protein CyaY
MVNDSDFYQVKAEIATDVSEWPFQTVVDILEIDLHIGGEVLSVRITDVSSRLLNKFIQHAKEHA